METAQPFLQDVWGNKRYYDRFLFAFRVYESADDSVISTWK